MVPDKSVVEEGILDIKMMDHTVTREGEGENGSNSGELDDKAEGLIVVHSRALGEAPKDPTSLVAVEGVIRHELVTKNPLVHDQVGDWWVWHQVLGVVSQQGHILLLHSVTPVGSARAARTEEGTEEALRGATTVSAVRIGWSTGWRTSTARQVSIGWTCRGRGGWRPDSTREAQCGPTGC
jgi:hypothetical protein